MTEPLLLDVADLRVSFRQPQGWFEALRGVSLRMGRERVAIVGESGSGKSAFARSLLGLLPPSASVSAARALFRGKPLLGIDPREQRAIRGRHIGMILQDPLHALNPVLPVGRQIAEMVRRHTPSTPAEALRAAQALLADLHIRNPSEAAALYPHQISGGMGQRVMIAMMLAGQPELLIADEMTSALDAVVKHRVLELLNEQIERRGMGLLLISHDLDLVARHTDRVLVMYAGRIVEDLASGALDRAQHPYTRGLMACRPALDRLGDALPTLAYDPAWLS